MVRTSKETILDYYPPYKPRCHSLIYILGVTEGGGGGGGSGFRPHPVVQDQKTGLNRVKADLDRHKLQFSSSHVNFDV